MTKRETKILQLFVIAIAFLYVAVIVFTTLTKI